MQKISEKASTLRLYLIISDFYCVESALNSSKLCLSSKFFLKDYKHSLITCRYNIQIRERQGGDFLKGKEKSISRSELVVMKVLWKEGCCPASRVIDQVAKQSDWHFRTVKTLLRNLVAKGFVGYEVDERDSRVYYYMPLIDEEQYLQQERQLFLHLYYGGDRSSLLAGFLRDGELSAAEAEKLRRMLGASAEEE